MTIEVNKTNVKVGDTVTVIAILENLSGRNVRIKMTNTTFKKLEDMILSGIFLENEEHFFPVRSVSGPRKKMTIKKNAAIIRTVDLETSELSNYEAASAVSFYTGKGYSKLVKIYSESVKIFINEDD